MGSLSLEHVWCADIIEGEGRTQADGKWYPGFQSDTGRVAQFVYVPEGAIFGQQMLMPTVNVNRGGVFYPNGAAGYWMNVDQLWVPYATDTIVDNGMWATPNIGWAPDDPMRWGRPRSVTDLFIGNANLPGRTAARTSPVASHFQRESYVLSLQSGSYGVGAGGAVFRSTVAEDEDRIWVNKSARGDVFLYYDWSTNPRSLTVGILGTTWLPQGSLHLWDVFEGIPNNCYVTRQGSDGTEIQLAAMGLSTSQVVSGASAAGSNFKTAPQEAVVDDRKVTRLAAIWFLDTNFSAGNQEDLHEYLSGDAPGDITLHFDFRPVGARGDDKIGTVFSAEP